MIYNLQHRSTVFVIRIFNTLECVAYGKQLIKQNCLLQICYNNITNRSFHTQLLTNVHTEINNLESSSAELNYFLETMKYEELMFNRLNAEMCPESLIIEGLSL